MAGHHHTASGNRFVRFIVDNSLPLIIGTVIALGWANAAHLNESDSYARFVNLDLGQLFHGGHSDSDSVLLASAGHADAGRGDDAIDAVATSGAAPGRADDPGHASATAASGGHDHGDGGHEYGRHDGASHDEASHQEGSHGHGFTMHFLVNDILMALFFAIAGKEVWESLLPGGALANPKKAITPLLATIGGVFGPALVYIVGSYFTGTYDVLGKGWAVPCATDIAFSYLIARMIFGAGHPAIAFLLLLAIADDAAGLIILAIFYPQAPIEPSWLLLTLAAMLVAMVMRRRLRLHSHWWYMLGPGVLCWISFYMANIHPALGLVPIIPLLPHAHTDLGIFARVELKREDTLSEFESFWKTPVEGILGLFGLVNAGVVFSSLGVGTYLVLAGLLVGKPLGVLLLTWFAEKVLHLEKPAGMDYRHVATVGMVAGIGFTVALFVSVAAFRDPGAVQDSVKMGALLSFAAAPLALLMGKVLNIRAVPAGVKIPSRAVAHQV